MTATNPLPEQDIKQEQYENAALAVRVLAVGKTTSGTYVPILVNDDGSPA